MVGAFNKIDAGHMASMRPRRVRLGWLSDQEPEDWPLPGFNEAEARAPRMASACRWLRSACRRFNEAEARAPRMV